MFPPKALVFLARRNLTSIRAWARAAGLKEDLVYQGRHRGHLAEVHVRALARAVGTDAATVKRILFARGDEHPHLRVVASSPSNAGHTAA